MGAAKERRPKSVPRLQYQLLQSLYAESSPADDGAPIHSDHCCSLLELSEERCRWPISTPGAADFCFCGNTPLDGLPYCPGHTRIAYRPGSRQRVARR
jgi:GcrA cell cycle regulator